MKPDEFLHKATKYLSSDKDEARINRARSGIDPAQAERAQREAEKAAERAQRDAERAQREAEKAAERNQKDAERYQRAVQKEMERAAGQREREAERQLREQSRREDQRYAELGRQIAAAKALAAEAKKGNPYGDHKLFGSKDHEPSKTEGSGSRYGRDWNYRPGWDKRGTEADARGRQERDDARERRREDVDRQQAAERARRDAEEAAERARRDAEYERRRNS
jgi:hypothetical protein